MVLKNLLVSACVLGFVGNFSFAEDVISPVPLWYEPEVSEDIDSVTPEPSTIGGMDPTLRRIYQSVVVPTKTPLVADNGGFVVSSVESFTVNVGISSCSFIARKNLLALLEILEISDPWIAQGDALDLIRFGKFNRTLTSFSDKRDVILALDKRRVNFYETVFDVYRYVPTRWHALQWHRVTVFLGEDDQWYLLDTIDGAKTTAPQLFSTYLANDIDNAEWLVRTPGYSRVRSLSHDGIVHMFPFLSSELQLFLRPELLALTEDASTTEIIGHHEEISTSQTSV